MWRGAPSGDGEHLLHQSASIGHSKPFALEKGAHTVKVCSGTKATGHSVCASSYVCWLLTEPMLWSLQCLFQYRSAEGTNLGWLTPDQAAHPGYLAAEGEDDAGCVKCNQVAL